MPATYGEGPAQNHLQVREKISYARNYQSLSIGVFKVREFFCTVIYRLSLHSQWWVTCLRSENITRTKLQNANLPTVNMLSNTKGKDGNPGK